MIPGIILDDSSPKYYFDEAFPAGQEAEARSLPPFGRTRTFLRFCLGS